MSVDQHKVDFSGLMLGFSSAALSYMGIEEGSCKNLELAKQNIDVMCMLSTKTRGNLTQDEESLLSELLIDLKKKYVEACDKT